MRNWIVVTTINMPTTAIDKISELCETSDWNAVVVGDLKTPTDWKKENIHYLSPLTQKQRYGELAEILPWNHYSRKNLGYLFAIEAGAEVILETDDDNIPYAEFGQDTSFMIEGNEVTSSDWVNVYKFFTDHFIWPRGLPLNKIYEYGTLNPEIRTKSVAVKQYLADEDPDIDAIHRLLFSQPVNFNRRKPVILGEGAWVPFNSQNTMFSKKVFPLLYLPSHVSFRMTDIWRSLVVQSALWKQGSSVAFLNATVKQQRNEHNLMEDFKDEVPGYLLNDEIRNVLQNVLTKSDATDPLVLCELLWNRLMDEGIIPDEERRILNAWISHFN